ncbi:unnamed protein product [Citrullus colocynthis]|uniref:S-protein homolog n=1 Tax=Citrullus colocynthis TaxID=252529 RepID=A0ABP0YYZ3_9ROSI
MVIETSLGAPFEHWGVEVSNEMQNGQTLFLQCKSKDDDLGKQYLKHGQKFSWKFRENLWQNTLYWCYMSNDHNHVSLEVFWPESASNPWLAYRCRDNVCYWSARNDGIYIYNVPENKFEFHSKWLAGF